MNAQAIKNVGQHLRGEIASASLSAMIAKENSFLESEVKKYEDTAKIYKELLCYFESVIFNLVKENDA